MAEIAVTVGVEVVKCAANPLGRHFCYAYGYATYIEKLKQQALDLDTAKACIEHQVNEAESKGDEIEDCVKQWLSDVACKSEVVDQIIMAAESADKSCFFGLCPNLKTRHRFGRKTAKMATELTELMDRKKFDRISYAPPRLMIPDPIVQKYVPSQSRSSYAGEITEALKDPNVHVVGVYGMGGIGKTTILHQVAKEVKATKMFQLAVIATVKQKPDLSAIRGEIAKQLGLVLPTEMPEEDRKDRLWRKLKQQETVLVILDDLWENFDYHALGIPFGENHEGCKLLLTSRFLSELRKMGTHKTIQIGFLKEPEDWDLFKKIAGSYVEEDQDLMVVAKQIVNACSGLPISLVTMAGVLKDNKELYDWKDCLERLKTPILTGIDFPPMEKVARLTIELSYDHLESEELKLFFLLCAVSADCPSIEYLVRHAMGWGLFKGIRTMEKAWDRVYASVNKLKASCLLTENNSKKWYVMHDFVRDVGRSIAYRKHNMITVSDGASLEEWLNDGTLKSCTSLALWKIVDLKEFPRDLLCPQLEFFTMDCRRGTSLTIPDNFFIGMNKIRVIDVDNMRFTPRLPSSIQYLVNLCTLCLNHCLLGDMTMIGKLKNLEILSVAGSVIKQFPRELGNLTRLRLLDFRRCTQLKLIPANVISSLIRLEELYIGNSFDQWEEGGPNASLAELKDLTHLTTLEIYVQDVMSLPPDFFLKELERYKIYVGDTWEWIDNVGESSRVLKIKDDISGNAMRQNWTIELSDRVEAIFLDNLRGVNNICSQDIGEGFLKVKQLCVQNSPDVQFIIDTAKKIPCLEIMNLQGLSNLKQICHGQYKRQIFDNLKEVKVKSCNKLKSLFSFPKARDLLHLRCIEVADCEVFQGIVEEEEVAVDNTDGMSSAIVEFTQLNSMVLMDLPELVSFCFKVRKEEEFEGVIPRNGSAAAASALFNEKFSFPSLSTLDLDGISTNKIWHCSLGFQNLCTLKIKRCGNLTYLLTSCMATHLVQLRQLKIHGCDALEEIVLRDDSGEDKTHAVVFGKLEQLELHLIRNLKGFITGRSLQFPSLKQLIIRVCPKLEAMTLGAMDTDEEESGRMRVLEESQYYSLFNEKVSFPVLESVRLINCGKLKAIWGNQLAAHSFCNLRVLHIARCGNLQTLFVKQRSSVRDAQSEEVLADSLKCGKLRVFHIDNCPNLKSLFLASVARSFKEVEVLHISLCKELEEIIETSKAEVIDLGSYFSNLKNLELFDLPKLKRHCLTKHLSEWIPLKHLLVRHCHNVDVFGSQTIVPVEKAFPNLESLSLDSQSIRILQHQEHLSSMFYNILKIDLVCFHEESVEFPFSFLKRFQNLSHLGIYHSSFQEIFAFEGLGEEEHEGALATLRELCLYELHDLKNICKDDTFSHRILQRLERIFIMRCHSLMAFAPITVSYQNLKTLEISNCAGMKRLMSSSTAKSLVQLRRFDISGCRSIEEVVANEDDLNDNISFEKLSFMRFRDLPKIRSFCCGIREFNFPSLKEVILVNCPQMEYFSHEHVSSPKLKGIQLGSTAGDKIIWKGNLNSTIQSLFLARMPRAPNAE